MPRAEIGSVGVEPDPVVGDLDGDGRADDIVTAGNTSSASIPLALSRMIERGEIPSGAPALLIGFGAGICYAAQVITIP